MGIGLSVRDVAVADGFIVSYLAPPMCIGAGRTSMMAGECSQVCAVAPCASDAHGGRHGDDELDVIVFDASQSPADIMRSQEYTGSACRCGAVKSTVCGDLWIGNLGERSCVERCAARSVLTLVSRTRDGDGGGDVSESQCEQPSYPVLALRIACTTFHACILR